MGKKILPYSRRAQILQALYEHGPLSNRTLRKIVSPPMDEKRIQGATKRLYDRKLIVRRHDSLPRNAGHYYQLSQRLDSREAIAKILNCQPDDLLLHHFRSQELVHSEYCALWAEYFKAAFPQAKVIHDFQFKQHPSCTRVLLSRGEDLELKPDLLIQMPKTDGAGQITIAIEIEKTRKSRQRLLRKLNKISSQTLLDGVIFVCEKDVLRELIRGIYCQKVSKMSLRTAHYADNFLLFSPDIFPPEGGYPVLINSKLSSTSLEVWISYLLSTDLRARRDHKFEPLGEHP